LTRTYCTWAQGPGGRAGPCSQGGSRAAGGRGRGKEGAGQRPGGSSWAAGAQPRADTAAARGEEDGGGGGVGPARGAEDARGAPAPLFVSGNLWMRCEPCSNRALNAFFSYHHPDITVKVSVRGHSTPCTALHTPYSSSVSVSLALTFVLFKITQLSLFFQWYFSLYHFISTLFLLSTGLTVPDILPYGLLSHLHTSPDSMVPF